MKISDYGWRIEDAFGSLLLDHSSYEEIGLSIWGYGHPSAKIKYFGKDLLHIYKKIGKGGGKAMFTTMVAGAKFKKGLNLNWGRITIYDLDALSVCIKNEPRFSGSIFERLSEHINRLK